MTNKQTQDVAEAIQMIQAIKQHLQEEGCTHTIETIVKEALKSKGLRRTTSDAYAYTDADITNSGTNRNGREINR